MVQIGVPGMNSIRFHTASCGKYFFFKYCTTTLSIILKRQKHKRDINPIISRKYTATKKKVFTYMHLFVTIHNIMCLEENVSFNEI